MSIKALLATADTHFETGTNTVPAPSAAGTRCVMISYRIRSERGAEGGFTLVETLVASFIATLLFVAFSMSMRHAFVESRDTRFRQEATSIAVEYVESARALEWPELAMITVDPSAPWIDPDGTLLLASEAGIDADEELLVLTSGQVVPLVTESVQDVTFDIWSYVTTTGDLNRRYVVVIEWAVDGTQHRLHMSTVISEVAA